MGDLSPPADEVFASRGLIASHAGLFLFRRRACEQDNQAFGETSQRYEGLIDRHSYVLFKIANDERRCGSITDEEDRRVWKQDSGGVTD